MVSELSLGAFLRSRRERLAPADVGLRDVGRRRTPGLRREEVALLAGISVDYLVRLEQGRERSPSAAVLAALSDALRLTDDEKHHAAKLVAAASHSPMCPSVAPPSPLQPSTLAILDRLDPTPAYVVDDATTVVGWNAAFERLMRPTALFDLEPPNLLRYLFLLPTSRQVYRDWSATARDQVSNLRAASARPYQRDAVEAIVGELGVKSVDFARLWATHDVGEKRQGILRLDHPAVGHLDLQYDVLLVNDARVHQLVTYLPADNASEAALDRALGEVVARPTLRILDRGA